MKPIVIFGAGGFAREVLGLLRDINAFTTSWDLLGFVDDDSNVWGGLRDGLPILGGRDWLAGQRQPPHVVIATGNPVSKRRLASGLRDRVAGFPSLVHPSVISTSYVMIGEGSVITAGNILTSQVDVGAFAMINLACTIGHDVRIGSFVTISPGCNISGNVVIGEGADIGTGSKIVQGVTVGEWSVIGAGAVVTREIPANCTAVGMPAKAIKQRPPGWHSQ